jgi:hypothetical protein
MGTIYYFATGKEQDPDTREWYKYETEYWYVFCDKCESVRVVPTGYRMTGTREVTTYKRTLFHGQKTVIETRDIYTREFKCKECGSSIVIQPDEITGNNRLSHHQVPHLMSKISKLEARARDEARNIYNQRRSLNRNASEPEAMGEAVIRVGVPRKYNNYDLLCDSSGDYQRSLNAWIKDQAWKGYLAP